MQASNCSSEPCHVCSHTDNHLCYWFTQVHIITVASTPMPHSYPMAHGFTAPAATAAWRQMWIDEKKEAELKAVTILKAAVSSASQLHNVRS